MIGDPVEEKSVHASSECETQNEIRNQSEMSDEPPAASSSHSAGGTPSAPQSSVPKSNALNPIQRLIHLASRALEVPKVDAKGLVIPKESMWIRWYWNEYRPYSDCGPLRTAIYRRWGTFPITTDDLYHLRDGISWAACVGNREFLQIWDDLVTDLSFQVDGLGKFGEELVKFIYDIHFRLLSPLHYTVLRNSVRFQNILLHLLSSVSDKEEYLRYVWWAPCRGLASGCSADHVLAVKHSRKDSSLMDSFLLLVGESLPNGASESHVKCSRWEEFRLLEPNFPVLTVLHHLCLDINGNSSELWKKLMNLSSGTREWLTTRSTCHKLTPLQMAVIAGNTTVVRELLIGYERFSVNINALDCGKRTALQWALYERHKEIVKLLVQHALQTNQPLDAAEEDSDYTTPVETALDWDSRGDTELADLLLKVPDVERQIDKQYRDRQVYVDAANAKLVGAALIASITFAGWLQPPLGYVQYDQYPVGGRNANNYKSFAALEQEFRVKIFWVFNSLSFFFAMATVLSGAGSVLPRNDLFITAAVRTLNRWLMATSVLLTISIMCGLGAFTAAGFAVLPPILPLEFYMIIPAILGLTVCLIVMLFYVQGIVKVLMVRYRNKQRSKNVSSGCDREDLKGFVQLSKMKLEELELVSRVLTLERLEYLHSVAVQIESDLNEEREKRPLPNMEEVDKKYNDVVDARLKSCMATSAEDVNCDFIQVRGGELRYYDGDAPVKLLDHFREKRVESEGEINTFLPLYCHHSS